MVTVSGKMYDVCVGCGNIVQFNKPLLGSLHFCTTDEEKQQYSSYISKKTEANKKALEKTRDELFYLNRPI